MEFQPNVTPNDVFFQDSIERKGRYGGIPQSHPTLQQGNNIGKLSFPPPPNLPSLTFLDSLTYSWMPYKDGNNSVNSEKVELYYGLVGQPDKINYLGDITGSKNNTIDNLPNSIPQLRFVVFYILHTLDIKKYPVNSNSATDALTVNYHYQ